MSPERLTDLLTVNITWSIKHGGLCLTQRPFTATTQKYKRCWICSDPMVLILKFLVDFVVDVVGMVILCFIVPENDHNLFIELFHQRVISCEIIANEAKVKVNMSYALLSLICD